HLGGSIGTYIDKEDYIEYAGFDLKLGEREVEAPGLKSAIKKGGLVLPYESHEFTSQPAIIGKTTMVEDDEKLVSTREDFNQKRRNPNPERKHTPIVHGDASSEGTPVARLSTPAKRQATDVT